MSGAITTHHLECLRAFGTTLHDGFEDLADAPFRLGDAVLTGDAVTSLPRLSTGLIAEPGSSWLPVPNYGWPGRGLATAACCGSGHWTRETGTVAALSCRNLTLAPTCWGTS
jgi:hypothetical protein